MTKKYQLKECLISIKCPVLLVWGANDQITPINEWKNQLHLIENAQLNIIDQCGHSPMFEKPEDFTKVVTAFLQKN